MKANWPSRSRCCAIGTSRWSVEFGPDLTCRLLGRRDRRGRRRGTQGAACPPTSTSATQSVAAEQPSGVGRRVRQAHRRLRELEDSVGRHQSLSASHRRDRAAVQRLLPSIPVGFTSSRWGSLARSARARSKGPRRCTARAGTALSRSWSSGIACGRKRSPPAERVAILISALQRSGAALQHRRSARCVFLSPAARRPHRARVPSGGIGAGRAKAGQERAKILKS